MRLRQRDKGNYANSVKGADDISISQVIEGRAVQSLNTLHSTATEHEVPVVDAGDSDYQGSEEETRGTKKQRRSGRKVISGIPVSQEVPTNKQKATKSEVSHPSSHTVNIASGIQRSTNRRNYALQIWSSDHRHKSAPFYRHQRRVERLSSPPKLFHPSQVIVTENWTSTVSLTERIGRSSTLNVGWGPVWELMEDRSWWKESILGGGQEEKEHNRRPRVYQSLSLADGWEYLNPMYDSFTYKMIWTFKFTRTATTYMPSGNSHSQQDAASSISCHIGPLENQQKIELALFESCYLGERTDWSLYTSLI